jgi:hypothetical protein
MFLLGAQTVTIVHLEQNEYGDHVETGRATYSGCQVQPLSSVERIDPGSDQVISRWTLYAPPSVQASPVDRVIAEGVTYELEGELQLWRGLDGRPDHVEAVLRRVSG